MNDQKLLSVCIPTYNRAKFLKDSLNKILKQIKEFESYIELIVSDNCSTDDTAYVVQEYIAQGYNIKYNRNDENLGMDGNFAYCFRNASAKYVWILGDDDYLMEGALKKIIEILSSKDLGILHFSTEKNEVERFQQYDNAADFLNKINVNITFISGNIVNANAVHKIDLNLYKGTLLTQVPVYLRASVDSSANGILHEEIMDKSLDGINNGGYNIFKIFVSGYLDIIKEYRSKLGFIWYEKQKFLLFKNFVRNWMMALLVNKEKVEWRFKTENWFGIILSKYYYEIYIYPYFCLVFLRKMLYKSK